MIQMIEATLDHFGLHVHWNTGRGHLSDHVAVAKYQVVHSLVIASLPKAEYWNSDLRPMEIQVSVSTPSRFT